MHHNKLRGSDMRIVFNGLLILMSSDHCVLPSLTGLDSHAHAIKYVYMCVFTILQHVKSMDLAVSHMQRLVNDVLDLAKLQEGKLEMLPKQAWLVVLYFHLP